MFNKIIESNEFVIENAKYVKVNTDEIKKFVENIKQVNIQNWLFNVPFNLLDENIGTIIEFLLYFEAIDFSFWGNPKWEIQTEKGKLDGSIALMQCLNILEKIKILII